MKLDTAEHTVGNINPAFLKTAVFIITAMTVMAGPLAARAKPISDSDGHHEQSAFLCQSIDTDVQEKESKQEEKAEPVEITAGITKPELTLPAIQPFPLKAALSMESGGVALRLIIKRDGSYEVFKILAEEPENLGFADAALLYLEESHWKPALKDGEPIDVYYDIVLHFLYLGNYTHVFQPPPEISIEDQSLQNESGPEESEPVDITAGITKPELTLPAIQPFPLKAALSGKSGGAALRLIIRSDGSYEVFKILAEEPENFGFADAARLYLEESHWKPALKDGEPIDVYYDIVLHFIYREGNTQGLQEIVYIRESSEKKQPPVMIYDAGAYGDGQEPELIFKVEPIYPDEAKKRWLDGYVLLEVIINEKGDVDLIKVLEANPARFGFVENSMEAISKWKFKPTYHEGKPVKVRIRFSVEFNRVY